MVFKGGTDRHPAYREISFLRRYFPFLYRWEFRNGIHGLIAVNRKLNTSRGNEGEYFRQWHSRSVVSR